MCTKCMQMLNVAMKNERHLFSCIFFLQEKKFQCEAIVEKFGILNSLLELLELCQANLVQIKLMGSSATTPVYVFFCVLKKKTVCTVFLASYRNMSESLENGKCCGNMRRQVVVSTTFLSSPKLSRVFL